MFIDDGRRISASNLRARLIDIFFWTDQSTNREHVLLQEKSVSFEGNKKKMRRYQYATSGYEKQNKSKQLFFCFLFLCFVCLLTLHSQKTGGKNGPKTKMKAKRETVQFWFFL